MFCSNCGNKVDNENAFCGNCGKSICQSYSKSASNTQLSQVMSLTPTKLKKISVLAGIILLTAIAVIAVASNRDGISGTWVAENSANDFPAIITFSGQNFTASMYGVRPVQVHPQFVPGISPLSGFPWRWDAHGIDFRRVERMYRDMRTYQLTYGGTFSVTGDQIEMIFFDGSIDVFQFSQTDNTLTIGRVGGSSQTRFIREQL